MIFNVILMIFGFGLVIAIHELGHFLAAKWAGVRVHAFAIGFGQAICSYRKGLGFRAGSSEREYKKLIARDHEGLSAISELASVSPTEYRLNWFPFGGYVKMLGQEDIDPAATSSAPDSYTQKPVWKRMVIISAGVVMNIILAAVLFVAVFLAGGLYKPAPVIGAVMPGSPADKAGLQAGDIVRSIDGQPAEVFEDLLIASAMGRKGRPLSLTVERDGQRLTIEATPAKDDMFGGLQGLGVAPGISNRLLDWDNNKADRELQRARMDRLGLRGIEPDMRAVEINNTPIADHDFALRSTVGLFQPIERAAEQSGGNALALAFENEAGDTAMAMVLPDPDLQSATTTLQGEPSPFSHLLGLTPVMRVRETQPRGYDQGLRQGDVFALIGDAAFPSLIEGIEQIRAHKGRDINLAVLRNGTLIQLTASVSTDNGGTIGFGPGIALDAPILAQTPNLVSAKGADEAPAPLASSRLTPGVMPGLVITAINGTPVTDWRSMREALKAATSESSAGGTGATVTLTTALMIFNTPITLAETNDQQWELTADDVRQLHALGWNAGELETLFQPAQIEMKAANPFHALAMGVRSTKRVLAMTYITFLRLFEGTVKVSHLKGPVGITQIGSQMANQGFVYLLYFLALVSANLAVVNFLPIPIADGGHFVMLAYEGITKKPVPIAVQNALTMLGLILIGAVFLIVTMNDIRGLF